MNLIPCETNRLTSPVNLLINVSNLIVYIIVIIIFFLFVISKEIDNIILDKTDIIISLANNDENIKNQLLEYLKTVNISKLAVEESTERYSYNISLLSQQIYPYLYTLGSLDVLIIGYIMNKKIKISKTEYLLLMMIFIGFSTEIVFYYTMIKPWKFIGDYELLQLLYNNL